MTVSVIVDAETGLHRLKGSKQARDVNHYLEALAVRGLSPRTIRAYAYDLLRLVRWLEDRGGRIRKTDERDMLEFVRHQREEQANPRSINRRLCTARLFYRFLTGRELPKRRGVSSPAPYYRGRGRDRNLGIRRLPRSRHNSLRVKVPKTIVDPLTVVQVRGFIQTLCRYRDLAIVYLMLLCGLRSREVLLLRLSDVLFDDNRLRVQGKGNKERLLPMPSLLVQTIRDYLNVERPDECGCDQLFVVLKGAHRGHPMTAEGLRRLFRYRRGTPELANANAHRFRHTFGLDMARGGVRLPILQKMMGHAHAETTLAYVNLAMADVAEEYERAAQQIRRRYEFERDGD